MTNQGNTPPRVGAQEQFGRQAQHYSTSAGHSSGESLQVVRDWASTARYGRAVDVATGTGFTAFTIAPFAESVVASDLTPEMIAETPCRCRSRLRPAGWPRSAASQTSVTRSRPRRTCRSQTPRSTCSPAGSHRTTSWTCVRRSRSGAACSRRAPYSSSPTRVRRRMLQPQSG